MSTIRGHNVTVWERKFKGDVWGKYLFTKTVVSAWNALLLVVVEGGRYDSGVKEILYNHMDMQGIYIMCRQKRMV